MLHVYGKDDEIEIIFTTSVVVGCPLWVATGLFTDAVDWIQARKVGIDLW